jgi:hypothetical protein
MIIIRKTTLAMAISLAWGLSALADQIPAGTYTNLFNGTASLYDISGAYQQNVSGLSFDCALAMDTKGKVTGQASAVLGDLTSDGVGGNIDTSFNGTVRSVKDATQVKLTVKMKGSISAGGTTVKFAANIKEDMSIQSGSQVMSGTASGSVTASVSGHGSKTVKIPSTPISLALPPNETGAWNLTLNLAPDGKKYSGVATATMAGGTSYPLTVVGSYSDKSGASKLTLKGDQGMTLTLAAGFQNGQLQLQGLKGKALGQKPHTP